MRYLAIDLGDKRTGLAAGDDVTGQAGPVGVIETSDPATLMRRLREVIDEHGPDALVVGVPYNMDGSEGPAAQKAILLAEQLREISKLPVHLMDERLTTFEADDLMRQSGLTHKQKKQRRDALAATAILRDFLATRKGLRPEALRPESTLEVFLLKPQASGLKPAPIDLPPRHSYCRSMSLNQTSAANDLVRRAVNSFDEHFDEPPTVAARAPGRVNLIGEHTDYNDGFVLPLAIDRYTVIVARANHSQRCRVVAADIDGEMATFINDESLAPGKTSWANYVKGVVAQFMRNGQKVPSFDAAIASDVPMGSGLSSSAALEVSTATLLELLIGIRLDPVRKALWCQKAEHEFAGVPCGIMDQMVSVAGRRGAAIMIDCRSLEHQPVAVGGGEGALLVTNSRVHHALGSSEYPLRRKQCEQAVAALQPRYPHIKALRDANLNELESMRAVLDDVIFRRARHVILENDRVGGVVAALKENELQTAGFLMNESHRSLRDDYEVSCRELDILADLAWCFPGVYGSRMTGGGFGGCTITLVKRDRLDALIEHLTTGYREKTGLEAICFPVEPADGAGAVTLG